MLNERSYPTPDSCLTHLFHGRGQSYNSVAYTVLVWSRLNAPVVLTRYTTPDTTIEIGSTSATVELHCGLIKPIPFLPRDAKRGTAIVSCPSVRPSVRDVDEPSSFRFG